MAKQAASDRRTEVWKACDLLAEQGVKPTRSAVASHYPFGSANDVQNDINDWYAHVFSQHSRRLSMPGIPESVLEQWVVAWEHSHEQAREQFAEQRGELQQQVDEARAETQAVREELEFSLAAEERASDANAELRARIEALYETCEEERIRAERLQAELQRSELMRSHFQELSAAAEKRHQEVVLELESSANKRVEAVKESVLREREALEASHRQQIEAQQEHLASLERSHSAALSAAKEHYRDLERRALTDVDAARQQAKQAEGERVHMSRAIQEKDRDLARLDERLAQLELRHSEQVAALRDELTSARERASRLEVIAQKAFRSRH